MKASSKIVADFLLKIAYETFESVVEDNFAYFLLEISSGKFEIVVKSVIIMPYIYSWAHRRLWQFERIKNRKLKQEVIRLTNELEILQARYDELVKNQTTIHLNQFECTICDKSFKTNFSLKRHIDSHNENKPFQCDLCDYKTKQAANLTRHKKSREYFHLVNSQQTAH